jgi:hypothetical protein
MMAACYEAKILRPCEWHLLPKSYLRERFSETKASWSFHAVVHDGYDLHVPTVEIQHEFTKIPLTRHLEVSMASRKSLCDCYEAGY